MEKTIIVNIQNEANVNAEGEHAHGRSIPVVCIDTGDVFISIIDAAENADTNKTYMANRLRNDDVCVIKGKRYCYLSRLMESSDMILSQLREKSSEAEDARKWREYQAEQEAKRLAEQKRKEALEKAEAHRDRRKAIYERLVAETKRAYEMFVQAEKEFNEMQEVENIA